MASINSVVETGWLQDALSNDQVRVIDATWSLIGSTESLVEGYIHGAGHYGIHLSDRISNVKHPLPSLAEFQRLNSSFGISHSDHIVCYDRKGVYASPRLWWTFKMMGHKNVSVLNGGLPAWIEAGHKISKTPLLPKNTDDFIYEQPVPSPKAGIISKDEILALLPSRPQIVDARSTDRFHGLAPEPRPGLRSGHIPGSISFPYHRCVENGRYVELTRLAENVGRAGIDLSRPIITTCGSGVTACILALAFNRLGASEIKVYDGSWSEWGASNAPIEV